MSLVEGLRTPKGSASDGLSFSHALAGKHYRLQQLPERGSEVVVLP